jgi:hypothetical protein
VPALKVVPDIAMMSKAVLIHFFMSYSCVNKRVVLQINLNLGATIFHDLAQFVMA